MFCTKSPRGLKNLTSVSSADDVHSTIHWKRANMVFILTCMQLSNMRPSEFSKGTLRNMHKVPCAQVPGAHNIFTLSTSRRRIVLTSDVCCVLKSFTSLGLTPWWKWLVINTSVLHCWNLYWGKPQQGWRRSAAAFRMCLHMLVILHIREYTYTLVSKRTRIHRYDGAVTVPANAATRRCVCSVNATAE
jgi:hypothetical protein